MGDDALVVGRDGTGLRRLTRLPRLQFESQMSWSPDGTKIAFSRQMPNFGMAIFVIDVKGTALLTQLTDPMGGVDQYPDWSPDGRQIVFSHRFQGVLSLWKMNEDGSNQQQIAGDGNDHPAWSPDGTTLAVDGQYSTQGGIYLLDDGTHVRQITSCGPTSCRDIGPSWSPDGHQLAFQRFNGTSKLIVVANADGSFTLNLAGTPGYAYVLEATTNVSTPGSWLPVTTNTFGTNGFSQFNDAQSTNFQQRFYRLKLLP